MDRKSLLFTFDYELFLGQRSGSVDMCVIKPTTLIIELFKKYKISGAIYFVDTTWLYRLKKLGETNNMAENDYTKVARQLKQLSDNGHYIFPHIHPHWNDAVYLEEINQWQLNSYSHYRFHSLSVEEREKVFAESIQILKEILGSIYSPVAYRAGGWSIQPFEDFKSFFVNYGIKYDFSVLPGKKCISSAQYYDFSGIEIKQPYSFNDEVKAVGEGSFVELPISTVNMDSFTNLLNRFLLKYLALKGNETFGDGQGVVTDTKEESVDNAEMVSVELLTAVKLNKYLNFLQANDYMQFITHPKMLSRHNLKVFEKFLVKVTRQYELNTDFKQVVKNYSL